MATIKNQVPAFNTVYGKITDSGNRPLGNLKIEIYDVDMREWQPLATTVTGRDGKYELHWTHDQLSGRGKGTADIAVKVFTREKGSELYSSVMDELPTIEMAPSLNGTVALELVPATTSVVVPTTSAVTGGAISHMMMSSGGGGGGGSSSSSSSSSSSGSEEPPPVRDPLESVDPAGEPFVDPAPPNYTPGYHPSRPVVDHRLSRAIARRLGRLDEALEPANLDIKTWEANARKGGFEGNYLRELEAYMAQGLTEEQAMDVLEGELRYIMDDVIARPVDSNAIGNALSSGGSTPEQLLIEMEEALMCQ